MKQTWDFPPPIPLSKISELSNQIRVPPILAQILISRGIENYDQAKLFFRPTLNSLHSPFLMKNMEKAVTRVIAALREKQKILVYGDYDVDGTTGASMLYLALEELGADVHYYIPDRQKDGYGLSVPSIQNALTNGYHLILSVDCGITAVEPVALAQNHQVDVIICDHHEPGEILPDAFAILDPKQEDCPYPYKELCGCGVAFKLLYGVYERLNENPENLISYLDLVAIASAADVVPLVDENRVLVKYGLEKLNQRNRMGIRILLEVAGLRDREITTGIIGFVIGPRINAVGRMGDATRAVRLLTTKDERLARQLAHELEEENHARQAVNEITLREAEELATQFFEPSRDRALVLHKEGWHQGVIGIVASKIVEKYYRPTVMISTADGIGKGSARSIVGFDIHHAISQCEDLLVGFGGHKYAAGLTIETRRLDEFKKRFGEIASRELKDEYLIPRLRIDGELSFDQITSKFIGLINQMAPFGPANNKPVFLTRDVEISGTPQIVGERHLKFRVRSLSTQGNQVLECIYWGAAERSSEILSNSSSAKKKIEIAYQIEENHFNGYPTVQLSIKDFS